MKRRVERYENALALQSAATMSIAGLLTDAIARRGTASLVLSGGSTPKAIYELLAAGDSQPDWSKVKILWGDERCVAPTHPDSNYRMAREALLNRVAIPEENIFRIEAERDPRVAAEMYETRLRGAFQLSGDGLPRFDIVLLGLGEDGHTASLFPGTSILHETRRLAAEVFVPKLNAFRVSMTFPVFNRAETVLFLVTGAGKAEILREVLTGEPYVYPAQRVAPTEGTLRWLVDAAAADNLQSTIFHHHSSIES